MADVDFSDFHDDASICTIFVGKQCQNLSYYLSRTCYEMKVTSQCMDSLWLAIDYNMTQRCGFFYIAFPCYFQNALKY